MSPRLVVMAQLLTGDAQRGEDLAQSALVAVYQRWGRLDDPVVYARRCVLNGHRTWWRRRGGREHLPGDVPDLAAVTDIADDAVRRDLVTRALALLTDRERAVVVLRYLEDLTEAETARELNLALGTVKSTAARALTRPRAHHHPQRARRVPRPHGEHQMSLDEQVVSTALH
ncbi:MAG: sigma-70 family RNA polymerase sigma factor, partial [Actinomycetota bacterium]|nr:sigma-70 family RNA polymerase sigma factor [Actinomycetota bacterium]